MTAIFCLVACVSVSASEGGAPARQLYFTWTPAVFTWTPALILFLLRAAALVDRGVGPAPFRLSGPLFGICGGLVHVAGGVLSCTTAVYYTTLQPLP
jgi:hypothetical protein